MNSPTHDPTPTDDPRPIACCCDHELAEHDAGGGACEVYGCGCRMFRDTGSSDR